MQWKLDEINGAIRTLFGQCNILSDPMTFSSRRSHIRVVDERNVVDFLLDPFQMHVYECMPLQVNLSDFDGYKTGRHFVQVRAGGYGMEYCLDDIALASARVGSLVHKHMVTHIAKAATRFLQEAAERRVNEKAEAC